jgi:hypothetical protein
MRDKERLSVTSNRGIEICRAAEGRLGCLRATGMETWRLASRGMLAKLVQSSDLSPEFRGYIAEQLSKMARASSQHA